MKRGRLLSLAILCLVFLIPMPVTAQGKGVLQGRVINGTTESDLPANLEVTLRVFQGTDEKEMLSTTTDAQGLYRFEDLEVGGEWSYLALVTYQGVVYSQGIVSFELEQREVVVDVQVYETTAEDTWIGIERAHIFVAVTDTGLSVVEMYVFSNPTDRTYIGKEQIDGQLWTSRFVLPGKSENLALDDGTLGGRFLATKDGFVDIEPHWPGSTRVLFSYDLSCPAGNCDLTREVVYPTSNLNVLVPDVGATVESERLVFDGTQQAEGTSYSNYVGRGLMQGQELDLRVRLPGSAPAPVALQKGSPRALPWIILGGVLAGLALVYPFWRQRVQDAARKEK